MGASLRLLLLVPSSKGRRTPSPVPSAPSSPATLGWLTQGSAFLYLFIYV